MSDIILLNDIPVETKRSQDVPEDWVVGRFQKRHGCRKPGQCGEDCDCGCPYKGMSQVDTLPLIDKISAHFPNEWLAFIVPPEEDDDPLPVHGKLVAHSTSLDDVQDAVLTVLWNQCIYVYYNGDVEGQQARL